MQWNDLPLNELYRYQPELTAQVDFDLFWNALKDEAQNIPLQLKTVPKSYPLAGMNVYQFSFAGFRNSILHGLLVEPVDRRHDAPVAVQFHGYNWNSAQVHYAFAHVLAGRSCLLLETRGQDLASPDHNLYPNGAAAGWLTKGILDKNQHYYTYVAMDGYRAIDALKAFYRSPTLPVIAEGISQGGGLALITAGLHPNVAAVAADVPFLSHFRRSVAISTQGPYAEIAHFFKIQDPLHQLEAQLYQTLSYIDAMNHAARIKAPALMSVGLEDDICPPSSVFAAYNHIATSHKKLNVYPDWGHGGFSLQEEEKIAFYQQVLN